MKEKIITLLRWTSVFPAFICGLMIGGLIVNLLYAFGTWFAGYEQNGVYGKIVYWVFSSFASGMLSVYWGVKTAPSYRKIVAVILEGLILIISVFGFLLIIYSKKYGFFWPLFGGIALSSGAGYVMYKYYEEGDNFKPLE